MQVVKNKQHDPIPPKPLTCRVDNGEVGRIGQATFDYKTLKQFVEGSSAPSFVVEDAAGNLVGIAHTLFIRELFLEKEEGTQPISLLDSHQHQNPPSLNV